VLAGGLRAVVLVSPALAATGAGWLAARVLPVPADGAAVLAVGRVALLVVVAVGAAWVVDRLVRRLMPLVVLLRMTMLFPDRAPSRFRLAREACTVDVERALRPRPGDDADSVARRAAGLLAALAAHDRHTRGHSQRVQVLAEMLARELKLSRADRERLRWSALLHDVGKLAVDSAILTKPAALDADEWSAMRAHPDEGARLCGPLLDWLGPWGLAVAQHHERYDGTGYPRGLAGEAIGYAGRLVCLVDAYETMTAARAYKKPMATRDARAELARCAGSHFDPVMVRAFLAIPLPRLLWALGPVSFLVQLPFLPVVSAGTKAANAALAAAGTGLVAGGTAAVIGVAVTAAAPAAPAAAVQAAVTGPAATGRSEAVPARPSATGGPAAAATAPGASVSPPTPTASSTSPGTEPSTGPSVAPSSAPSTGGGLGLPGLLPTALPSLLPGLLPTSLPTLSLPPLLPTSTATPAPSASSSDAGSGGSGLTIDLPLLPPITLPL
jgi:putative nucleotidyltransferase with HDIG domain